MTGPAAFATIRKDLGSFDAFFKGFSLYTAIYGFFHYFVTPPQNVVKVLELVKEVEDEELAQKARTVTTGAVHIHGNYFLVMSAFTSALAWGLDLSKQAVACCGTAVNNIALLFWPLINTAISATIFLIK